MGAASIAHFNQHVMPWTTTRQRLPAFDVINCSCESAECDQESNMRVALQSATSNSTVWRRAIQLMALQSLHQKETWVRLEHDNLQPVIANFTSYFNFNRPSNTLSLNQSVTTLPAAKSNCPPDVQHKFVYLNIITRTTPRGHTCFVDAVTAQQTITASLYNRHVLMMHSLHSRPQLLRFTMDMSEQTLIRGHPKTGPVHAHIAILST